MSPRRWWPIAVLLTALTFGPVEVAQACPSCKTANETDTRRPQAYMYSILFMMGMPAIVLTGFGVGFYRLSRRHAAAMDSRYADPGLELPGTDE